MENKFCFLKGLVECDSGRIQDCNNKRTVFCPLEQEALEKKDKKNSNKKSSNKKEDKKQTFCFLKGLVDCSLGRVQDCNLKRIEKCPKKD